MARRVKFVVNPVAGNKKAARIWPDLERYSRAVLGDISGEFTERAGDATRITRKALRDGYETIVAVGGDGTTNEVVNGFFDDGTAGTAGTAINAGACLCVVSAGTGGDWPRTWKMPQDLESITRCLLERQTRTCDLGLLTCRGLDGEDRSRFFINVADVGFGGEMIHSSHQSPWGLGPFLTYLTTLLRTLVAYRNKEMTLRIDEGASETR